MCLGNSDNNVLAYFTPKYNFNMHELYSVKENRKDHYILTSN